MIERTPLVPHIGTFDQREESELIWLRRLMAKMLILRLSAVARLLQTCTGRCKVVCWSPEVPLFACRLEYHQWSYQMI